MNFFEQELRKIVGTTHPDATYSGRVCYLKLGNINRAKLEFVTHGTADRYEALQVTVMNRTDGPVDRHTMLFRELIDVKEARDSCFLRDIPYAWTYYGQTEWYAYQPTAADYKTLSAAVEEYLDVFQQPEQQMTSPKESGPTMGMGMGPA